ncbi:MAG TPA: preprotein translocase subunit SecE [Persephonella sp.]|nr:preprotein translocase subunit SecE [Hydrogenothermaceae bacterium]HIQ24788.1 preprotein translocase subunit SecE [Persephonella sp.]
MDKLFGFLLEVKKELKKVTWPSPQQVKIATVAVIIFTLVISIYLWICDLAFSRIIDYLFK